MSKVINIPGRFHSTEVGNVATGANEILDDTKGKKQNVINAETDAELLRLENEKQDNLTFDNTPVEDSTNPITSGGVYASELLIHQVIETILALIPSAASALNQLADKAFVNSTVATASATFRGTYNVVTDLGLAYNASHQDIATALLSHIATADNNDYAFVQIPVSQTSQDIRVTERYKFDGTIWKYEYDLNNSGFTAAQWAAINSTITLALVEKLGALPTASELATALAGKQAVLTFDNAPVSGSDNPVKSGGLYNLFAAIDAKMPENASANNKLVAEDRLAAYVAAIIGALDATYNVTSTDGHVTVKVTQADGVITNVEMLTSDIASAASLASLTSDVAGLHVQVDALTGQKYVTVTATDQTTAATDVLPDSGQATDTIYRIGSWDGTQYDPNTYSEYAWDGTAYVFLHKENVGIDAVPTAGSTNLVESGGVVLFTPKPNNVPTDNRYIPVNSGKNLFNKDTINPTEGYLNFYGEFVAFLNWHVSDFIQVSPGATYALNHNTAGAYHILYDRTGTVRKGSIKTAEGSVITVPSDAFYIKLSLYGAPATIATKQFELGSESSEFEPYSDTLTKIDDKIKNVKDSLDEFEANVSDVVGTSTFIKIKDYTIWKSITDKVTQSGSSFTFATNATSSNYIGIQGKSLSNYLKDLVGKKIRVELVFNVSGDYAHLKSTDLTLNPSGVGEDNYKDVSTTTWKFGGDFVVTNPWSYFYINFYMQGATSTATLVLSGVNISLCDDEAYENSALIELINLATKSTENDVKETLIYCFATSGTDDATHFYGLTAIAKAIASITDASYNNRYRLIVDGYYHFTDPLTLISEGEGEYSVAFCKPYVSLEGTGKDKCVIFVDFPSDATFHDGKTWSDYQPIYIACEGEVSISNMTLLGKNCRYTIHLERDPDKVGNVLRSIKNCDVIHYGLDGFVSTGFCHAFGTGMGYDHIWNIEDCYIESPAASFAMHAELGVPEYIQGYVNFKNCTFNGRLLFSEYPQNSEVFVNFIGSNIKKGTDIYTSVNYRAALYKLGNYATTKIKMDNVAVPVSNNCIRGKVLKIEADDENTNVEILTSGTAFNYIVGDSSKNLGTGIITDECLINTNGVFRRSGSVGLRGLVFGSIDCDEASETGYRSLGKLLGDCSVTNKTLLVRFGSTYKTITFNEDYSTKDNAYVLEQINTVLNGLATASVFCPAIYQYPEVNGLERVVCDDTTAILKGMGVVYTSTGVRRALNNDGYIDGIAIDDIGVGELGRIITKGSIYSYHQRTNTYRTFTTLEATNAERAVGDRLGISSTTPGVFDAAASPKVLRAVGTDILEIV